jgi:hypothetical protein
MFNIYKDPDPVILVRPGSSIWEYEQDLRERRWLLLHVHPMAFTIPGALLFCRQAREENHNLNTDLRHSNSPIKMAVFYSLEHFSKQEIVKMLIEFPQVGGLPIKYRHVTFVEAFDNFQSGITSVRFQLDKIEAQEQECI